MKKIIKILTGIIAKKRFNYVDLIGISGSITLESHDYTSMAVLVFVLGIILSVTIEIINEEM